MTPLRAASSKDSAGERRQRLVDQIKPTFPAKAFKKGGKTHVIRLQALLSWLMLPLLIAFTMETCGWISLLGIKRMAIEDTRARIQADYSLWPFLSFLPIDPAILEEISEETGRTITNSDGYSTSQPLEGDPTPTPAGTTTGEPTSALTPSVTPTAGSASPTATLETSFTPTVTSTPPPPATPTTQGYKHSNYTSTPNLPNPTATDDHRGN